MPRRIPPSAPGQKPDVLKDPCDDRPVKEAPLPPAQLLHTDVLFNSKGVPDIDLMRSHLNLEGALSQEALLDLIKKASDLFAKEPNLLKLNDPITVVGDIHGQFYDLVKLLEVGGAVGEGQYIFLGDYVDRGSFSIETAALLFANKIAYPKRIRMLRGNHECRQMTSFFNFREECEYKYDESVYNAFMDAFDTLPLAATINGKFLAVHGGLSPDLTSLKGITSLDRFCEPPREGPLCDIIWADPYEKDDQAGNKKKNKDNWFIPNQVRGCSYFYTFDYVNRFLQKNSLLSVIRAHEAQLEGYKMHKTNPQTGFPSVITIFSAPNYCDVYNNKGAILKFDNSTLNVLQFNCSPHPYHLPNFMDIFAWSMPFVIEKVTEMLYYVLQPAVGDTGPADDDQELPSLPPAMQQMIRRDSLSEEELRTVEFASQLAQRVQVGATGAAEAPDVDNCADARDRMRKKVRTIARMARMFKTLRQENETVLKLKGVCPGHRMQAGLLLAGKDKLNSELEKFGHACDVDLLNELRPETEAPATPATVVRSSISASAAQLRDDDEDTPAGDDVAPPFKLNERPA